jgi:hypothetical protein
MKTKLLMILTAAMLLSGCFTTGDVKKGLENDVVMSVNCDNVYSKSGYGPWGITSKIKPETAKKIAGAFCK